MTKMLSACLARTCHVMQVLFSTRFDQDANADIVQTSTRDCISCLAHCKSWFCISWEGPYLWSYALLSEICSPNYISEACTPRRLFRSLHSRRPSSSFTDKFKSLENKMAQLLQVALHPQSLLVWFKRDQTDTYICLDLRWACIGKSATCRLFVQHARMAAQHWC